MARWKPIILALIAAVIAVTAAPAPAGAARVLVSVDGDPNQVGVRLVGARVVDGAADGSAGTVRIDGRLVGEAVLPANVSGFELTVTFATEPRRRHWVLACSPAPGALARVAVRAAMMVVSTAPLRWMEGVQVRPEGACGIVARGTWTPERGMEWEGRH